MYQDELSPAPASALVLSICNRIQGRFKEAVHWADLGKQRGGDSVVVGANAGLKQVEIWIDLGQHARAGRELDELAGQTDLPFGHEVYAWCVRAHAQRMKGVPFAVALERALALLPEGNRPDLQHRILLMRALLESPLQVLALTERVIEDARTNGHQGTVMAAWARRAACLWRHDPALALDAAQRALELARSVDSVALYRPELWLNAAHAMRACGMQAQAQQQLVLARDWIMHCVNSGQVPEPFVESFLQRNPINREVLALLG
jgi:hypothetical protein